MQQTKFGTVFNCMDGRTQIQVNQFLREKYGLDYVDTITEPGVDGILSGDSGGLIDYLKEKAGISINKHGSGIIAIVGHHDCAGNPVDKTTHIEQVKTSIDKVTSWGFPADVIGIWVNENWEVEVIE